MLYLVGLGLWDQKDITLRGLEIVKNADAVYAEFYTSKLGVGVEELEKSFGRKIEVLKREDLEEKSFRILERAKKENVAILVAGDPMIATTHVALVVEAKKLGIGTRIISNASIINAVCSLTGLQSYRFGKSATISWHRSRAFIDVIKANLSIDAHTLLLLDLNPPMKIEDAVERILELEESLENHFAVGIARAGSENPAVKCDRLKRLREFDFGDPLHTMVILSRKIHFMEFEALRLLASAPEDLKGWIS